MKQHSYLMRFEPNLHLHCMDCGKTTPGWSLRNRLVGLEVED